MTKTSNLSVREGEYRMPHVKYTSRIAAGACGALIIGASALAQTPSQEQAPAAPAPAASTPAPAAPAPAPAPSASAPSALAPAPAAATGSGLPPTATDRKSTRLNSS